jgi:hypothetical protein
MNRKAVLLPGLAVTGAVLAATLMGAGRGPVPHLPGPSPVPSAHGTRSPSVLAWANAAACVFTYHGHTS